MISDMYSFPTRIVYWIDAWEGFLGKDEKLSPQTFTSLKHLCLALSILVNHLTSDCGLNYILLFLQKDSIEHHFGFGLYRMLSGVN